MIHRRAADWQNEIRIAKHHDAHLTGVVRHGLSFLHRQFSVHLPTSILDQLKANEQRQLEDIAERFRQITREAGWAERSQFIDLEPGRDGPLTEFSRAFDLVVMGNHTFTQHDEHLSPHPDLLALRSDGPYWSHPRATRLKGLRPMRWLPGTVSAPRRGPGGSHAAD